jgi:hypothetical protein
MLAFSSADPRAINEAVLFLVIFRMMISSYRSILVHFFNLLLLAAVGVVDYLTGYEMSFSI